MAVIHEGNATSLIAKLKAECADGDVAYIYLESFSRKMVFDSAATNATDIVNHPYYIRPVDYAAAGVWVEEIGADQPEVWSLNQIITGKIQSTNLAASTGTELDMDLETLRFGGSDVDAAGSAAGIFTGLDSGAYKLYVGDGSNKYIKFDATDFTINLTNLVIDSSTQTIKLGTGNDLITLDAADATYRLAIGHATYGSAPFRVTKAGVLTATGANITGAITAATIDIGGADATSFHVDINGNIWSGAATYNIATNPFAVSNAGVLRAVSGTIGGFTLGATTLTATNLLLDAGNQEIKLGSGNDIISLDAADGTYRLAIGHATYGSAPFRVTKAGAMTAVSGTIGGWTLGATSLVSTNIGLHSGASAEILLGHATTYASAKIGLKNDGSGKLADNKIYWDASGNITLDVPANVGTGVGIIYKGGSRWLYDFNPIHNGTVQPDGFNAFLGVECGNLTMGDTATLTKQSSYNVGIGYQSLYVNTTGYQNVGVGYHSLYANTIGFYNIAIGADSLLANIGGYRNSAIGSSALNSNTTGYYNTALGAYTLDQTTEGDYNTGLGASALGNNTTGNNNVAIGYLAGSYQNDGSNPLQTPENSIYIGYGVLSGSVPAGGEDAIDNEIVIGYNAIGNGPQTVTLGNTNITNFHCQVALTVDSDERIKKNINSNILGLAFINALNPITFQRVNPFDYPDEIKSCEYKDRIIKGKDKEGKEIEKLIRADKRPPNNDRVYLGLSAQQVEEVMSVQGIDLELVTTSNRGKKAVTYSSLIMPLITAVQELSQKVDLLENKLN